MLLRAGLVGKAVAPCSTQGRQHAQHVDDRGQAQRGMLLGVNQQRSLAGSLSRSRRQPAAGHRDSQQHRCTGQPQVAQPGMQYKQYRDINQEPRGIEQRKNSVAGEKLTNHREVGEYLGGVALQGRQLRVQTGFKNPGYQRPVQLHTDTHQDPRAPDFQKAQDPQNQQQ